MLPVVPFDVPTTAPRESVTEQGVEAVQLQLKVDCWGGTIVVGAAAKFPHVIAPEVTVRVYGIDTWLVPSSASMLNVYVPMGVLVAALKRTKPIVLGGMMKRFVRFVFTPGGRLPPTETPTTSLPLTGSTSTDDPPHGPPC